MVTAFITVAALAWLCQMAFGGWQIYRFNREFDALCQNVIFPHDPLCQNALSLALNLKHG